MVTVVAAAALLSCATGQRSAEDAAGGDQKVAPGVDQALVPDLPTTAELGVTPDTSLDGAKPDMPPDDIPPPNAILVSTTGSDSTGCGISTSNPCQTIAMGIKRAASYSPRRPVVAAAGKYQESVTLTSGVHLYGGYNASFKKGGSGDTKLIIVGQVSGGEAVAVWAVGLTAETILDTLEVQAPHATSAGKSSYGVYVKGSPGLRIRDCVIKAGDGYAGVAGKGTSTPAPSGKAGSGGQSGANTPLNDPEPFGCPSPASGSSGSGGAPGAMVSYKGTNCQGTGGAGGNAGVDSCSGQGGSAGLGGSGTSGTCGPGKHSKGGLEGKGGDQDNNTCKVKTLGTAGTAGCDGRNGAAGQDGTGGTGGSAATGFWVGGAGQNGATAKNSSTGGGGGGGGGGGDCDVLFCPFTCLADWGGGGGGGGSAGCGGTGGTGGVGGGGSFGVFLVNSSSAITIKGCTITTGNGGAGGSGGKGQPGGKGGAGGMGGSAYQEGGGGGNGGKGGDGGGGGNGGGGAGGPSVGVYVGSGAAPGVSSTTYKPGTGGKGGTSSGKPGAVGVSKDLYAP